MLQSREPTTLKYQPHQCWVRAHERTNRESINVTNPFLEALEGELGALPVCTEGVVHGRRMDVIAEPEEGCVMVVEAKVKDGYGAVNQLQTYKYFLGRGTPWPAYTNARRRVFVAALEEEPHPWVHDYAREHGVAIWFPGVKISDLV